MHELPMTERILHVALRHAEASNATRIVRIHRIVVGDKPRRGRGRVIVDAP